MHFLLFRDAPILICGQYNDFNAYAGAHESRSVDISSNLGVFVIDAFTGRMLDFLEKLSLHSDAKLVDMVLQLQLVTSHDTQDVA